MPPGFGLRTAASTLFLYASALTAQNLLYPGTQPFIAVEAPVIALEHVRVIDGTGAGAREDQTIAIADGKISEAGPASQAAVPPNARRLTLANHTVIPGLVGMHEHLFYPSGGGVAIYTEHGLVSRASIWRAASRRRTPRGRWSRTPTSTSRN